MNIKNVIKQARSGRPDLAVKNLAVSRGDGLVSKPTRWIKYLSKFPHSSGQMFSIAYLATCYREGMGERV